MLTLADANSTLQLAKWIPVLPFAAMVICGLLGCFKSEVVRRASSWVVIAAIAGAFAISWMVLGVMTGGAEPLPAQTVYFFQWVHIGNFAADFSFYIDGLTCVMLMVVTGVGTLIALYASGYMAGDPGYFRFFAYIGLFIFAMTTLVMADNLLLLYLGWEGVGAASYLLIGYYYRKPSAVAAAKKAFIVNRVGDFGFALGLMATFVVFGTVQYGEIFVKAAGHAPATEGMLYWIPFLLMLGAFGKSAQLPLHVWLPDAMEGPTPVSALIHAATMVTAGVYMIARLMPLFAMNPAALHTISCVGTTTAVFAATIALCQYDIKRIWAYSTLSQLGFMFAGVGAMATTGAVFHLFTHAFFKALLFLTAGSVMHAMSGQLDLRKMSGLFRKMPVTAILMLIGCLALAGVPFTSGFFSKDMIVTDVLIKYPPLGWVLIATAVLTAFYTFRLWFRVFLGEEHYEMGHEHHGYEVDHVPDDHAHGPHELPWWPYNIPLCILAVGSLVAGYLLSRGEEGGWIGSMIGHSSAVVHEFMSPEATEHHHATHTLVGVITGGGAVVAILLAAFFHWWRRDVTAKVATAFAPVVTLLYNKYYIDELYDYAIRLPLRALGWISFIVVDRLMIDKGLIDGIIGHLPRGVARVVGVPQRGALQGYAMTMAAAVVVILIFVAWKVMAAA
jgi:NADH-quinone oxidoreductase subunit L